MSATDEASELDLDPGRVAEWLAGEEPPQLIDVREEGERAAGYIDGSRHIALTELSAAADSLERGTAVVFYCRVGSRSQMAAQAFRTAGFEAFSMRGGLVLWEQEGRPLSPEGGYVAEH